MMTPSDAVRSVVLADGNIGLAAEIQKVRPEVLLALITNDPMAGEMLQMQIRTKLVLDMAQTLSLLQSHLLQSIGDLSPNETTKAFTAMAELLVALISKPAPMPDGADALLRILPQGAADAVRQMMGSKRDGSGN